MKERYAIALTGLAGLMVGVAVPGMAYAQEVTLSLLTTNSPQALLRAEQYAADFMAANPDIAIEIETRPGGSEGDNLVKTRLATGVMNDIFMYNTGSLLRAINPERTLVDLSAEPFMERILDEFLPVVSSGDGIYGVPVETVRGGGIVYNRAIYEQLDLEVPRTWDEFMANNQAILDSGIAVPVIQSYRDTWTSQLLVLGDFYNVQAEMPGFAEAYTRNQAKFATTPAALKGFERLEAVHAAGYLNPDFGAAGYTDALRMLANGEGAHYPMLTQAFGAIADAYPDKLDDIGFFAQPGDDPEKNGLTIWLPNAYYIPQTSAHIEEAKRFLDFVASAEGCAADLAALGPTGPYLVEGCTLPEDVPPAVSDLASYIGEGGSSAPALEFLSPIKGPSLEQITVEVGSGIRSAAAGAALYDEDVRKQAQQLAIEGW